MKRTILNLLFFIILSAGIQSQSVQSPLVKHTFACTDYTQGLVCIISDEGKLCSVKGNPLKGKVLH